MLSIVLGAEHETNSHHQEANILVKRHRQVIEVNIACQKVIRAVEGSKMQRCEEAGGGWDEENSLSRKCCDVECCRGAGLGLAR